jgi:hypothetical protein
LGYIPKPEPDRRREIVKEGTHFTTRLKNGLLDFNCQFRLLKDIIVDVMPDKEERSERG